MDVPPKSAWDAAAATTFARVVGARAWTRVASPICSGAGLVGGRRHPRRAALRRTRPCLRHMNTFLSPKLIRKYFSARTKTMGGESGDAPQSSAQGAEDAAAECEIQPQVPAATAAKKKKAASRPVKPKAGGPQASKNLFQTKKKDNSKDKTNDGGKEKSRVKPILPSDDDDDDEVSEEEKNPPTGDAAPPAVTPGGPDGATAPGAVSGADGDAQAAKDQTQSNVLDLVGDETRIQLANSKKTSRAAATDDRANKENPDAVPKTKRKVHEAVRGLSGGRRGGVAFKTPLRAHPSTKAGEEKAAPPVQAEQPKEDGVTPVTAAARLPFRMPKIAALSKTGENKSGTQANADKPPRSRAPAAQPAPPPAARQTPRARSPGSDSGSDSADKEEDKGRPPPRRGARKRKPAQPEPAVVAEETGSEKSESVNSDSASESAEASPRDTPPPGKKRRAIDMFAPRSAQGAGRDPNRRKSKSARTEPDLDVEALTTTLQERSHRLVQADQFNDLLQKQAVTDRALIAQLEKSLAKERADNTRLEAQVRAMEATTLTRVMSSQHRDDSVDGGVPAATKLGKAAVAAARAAAKEAEARAQLPKLQLEILDRSAALILPYCKAVVRQYEVEEFLFGAKTIVYKWFPAPKELNQAKATDLGCLTAGRGLLGAGDGGGSYALESPMACAPLPAMRGGLFGIYEPMGQNFQDWLFRVAEFVVNQRSERRRLSDAEGMSVDELVEQCRVVVVSEAAEKPRKTLGKTIHNQISARKREAVIPFQQNLGFTVKRGKGRAFRDLLEAQEIIKALYSMSCEPFTEESGGYQPLEILDIAKKWLTTNDNILRRWRRQKFADCCAPALKKSLGEEDKADVDKSIGVDKFFKNATARKCYVRWAFVGKNHGGSIAKGFNCDVSILTLARLDAWMFCESLMALRDIVPPKAPGAEGGKKAKKGRGRNAEDMDEDDDDVDVDDNTGPGRNTFHNSLFEIVFPQAIEGVLREVRNVVRKVRKDELCLPFDPDMPDGMSVDDFDKDVNSKTPCEGPEGHGGDIHSQLWRRHTSSHLSPFDNRHYVVALPSFIKKHVCCWMGCVRDAFIGVHVSGTTYDPITADPVDGSDSGSDGGKAATP